jgi:hypothetical protein
MCCCLGSLPLSYFTEKCSCTTDWFSEDTTYCLNFLFSRRCLKEVGMPMAPGILIGSIYLPFCSLGTILFSECAFFSFVFCFALNRFRPTNETIIPAINLFESSYRSYGNTYATKHFGEPLVWDMSDVTDEASIERHKLLKVQIKERNLAKNLARKHFRTDDDSLRLLIQMQRENPRFSAIRGFGEPSSWNVEDVKDPVLLNAYRELIGQTVPEVPTSKI